MIQSLAIPDSAVDDTSDIRTKTEKIFQIARAAAIFCIPEIIVYHDPFLKPKHAHRERRIISRLLQYIECPQYLRKRLFPISRDMAAVGVLSPLATPHHQREKTLRSGEIREAAIFLHQGRVLADVGGKQILPMKYPYSLQDKTIRVTTRVEKTDDGWQATLADPPTGQYWGYKVHSTKSTLSKALQNRTEHKIATSRTCQILSVANIPKSNTMILVAFGGPYKGIPKILQAEGKKIRDVFDSCISILDRYGTRSLRLEEALMITLSKISS